LSEHTTTECLLFPDIFDRPVVAKFDQRQGSSDGGAILLQAAERRLGLTSALAAGLRDDRQPGKVQHELRELITQRVMAIALGYEDANDAARLACDPIHKLLVGRDPVAGEDLASQPTLSRFENAPDRKELLRMTEALADRVIERQRQRLHGRARRITIDLDPTDDPTPSTERISLTKECGWKDGDRGGLAKWEQTHGKKKAKYALTSTGLLMVNRPILIRCATKT
jgi:hypothetical protein